MVYSPPEWLEQGQYCGKQVFAEQLYLRLNFIRGTSGYFLHSRYCGTSVICGTTVICDSTGYFWHTKYFWHTRYFSAQQVIVAQQAGFRIRIGLMRIRIRIRIHNFF